MNELECDVDEMRDSVSVSSPFYPRLEPRYEQCFVEWASECEQPEDEDGDDAVAPSGEGGHRA
jgi:hypothetical protein